MFARIFRAYCTQYARKLKFSRKLLEFVNLQKMWLARNTRTLLFKFWYGKFSGYIWFLDVIFNHWGLCKLYIFRKILYSFDALSASGCLRISFSASFKNFGNVPDTRKLRSLTKLLLQKDFTCVRLAKASAMTGSPFWVNFCLIPAAYRTAIISFSRFSQVYCARNFV